MWPFKKKETPIKYRICKIHNKYRIQRFHPENFFWVELYYFHLSNEYRWLRSSNLPEKGILEFDSLESAKNKIKEFIPEYFNA